MSFENNPTLSSDPSFAYIHVFSYVSPCEFFSENMHSLEKHFKVFFSLLFIYLFEYVVNLINVTF